MVCYENYVLEKTPERTLDSLILLDAIRKQISEVVREQFRVELLHAHNLRACNRLLFIGPSGNGKTILAEALACELMYPLLVVQHDALLGDASGEIFARMKRLMDYAETQRCVLFFDEVEIFSEERGTLHATSEIRQLVSSLFLQIDNLPDYVVVVGASCHPELLDRAVWRHFQRHIQLPKPTQEQIQHHIVSIAKRCNVNFGCKPEVLAKQMRGFSFSEVEDFCLNVARWAILDKKNDNAESIVQLKLEQWKDRLNPIQDSE